MKTRKFIMTLGVVALTTVAFNAVAGDALLSPRAVGNEIKRVSGTNNDPNLAVTDHYAVISPRAAGNRTAAAGVNNELNPVLACRNMTASPKAIQACAMTPGMPGCKAEVAAATP